MYCLHFFLSFVVLGPHQRHMELLLPPYAMGTAMLLRIRCPTSLCLWSVLSYLRSFFHSFYLSFLDSLSSTYFVGGINKYLGFSWVANYRLFLLFKKMVGGHFPSDWVRLGSSIVNTVACVQALAQVFLHAASAAKKIFFIEV